MRLILPTLLILVLASCASPHSAGRASTENDIREAVFLYQFSIWKNQGANFGNIQILTAVTPTNSASHTL